VPSWSERELLWSDWLFLSLLAALVGYVLYVRRRRHLREPWANVARSRLGMMGAVVLSAYLAIGCLDSVHFRPSADAGTDAPGSPGELYSLFDLLAAPLRQGTEKTYSPPLAAYQYSREFVDRPGGGQDYVYPRLRHGGAHLEFPERERWPDILATGGRGLLQGLLCWLALSALLIAWQARRAGQGFAARFAVIVRGRGPVPWRTILLTAGALLLLAFLGAALGAKYHPLGTDKVGEDVLYQALKSIRTGLLIGTATTLIMLPFALILGVAAGYFRGWIDDIVQYLYITLASIPGVLLIASAILMAQVYMQAHADQFASAAQRADLRLLLVCLILGVTSWTSLCRLLRGEALKLREIEFVQAAQAFGVGHFAILARHILPNVMHIVLILLVLDFSALVLAEAVLSYVNIGVDPGTESWGNMINRARLELAREPVVWWSLAAAFAFMLGLVLAANLFADAVRDAFDPRLRGGE